MSIRRSRDLVFALVGTVGLSGGLSGVAAARPYDRDDQPGRPERQGAPPERFFRAEIGQHLIGDGRAETAAARAAAADRQATLPEAREATDRSERLGFRASSGVALPIRSDITNQIALRADGDDPRAAQQAASQGRQQARPAPELPSAGRAAALPLPIKKDILMRLEGGEGSLVSPTATPNEQRGSTSARGDGQKGASRGAPPEKVAHEMQTKIQMRIQGGDKSEEK